MSLAQNQRIAQPSGSPLFYAGRKVSEYEKLQMWQWLAEEPEMVSRELWEQLSSRSSGRRVSIRHLNRLRAEWGRSRRRGRPRSQPELVWRDEGEFIALAPELSFVGVHLFGHWLENEATFREVVERLESAIDTYSRRQPEESFARLHHRRETLQRRFQALFFAPLFQIKQMLGRIMAGSQAVITHDETGHTQFAAYYPPDLHLSRIIVTYCQQVSELTGSALFVIDGAVNSVALAVEFTQHQLGLLSMLDDNEYQGLASLEPRWIETAEDGTQIYDGTWKVARPEDPRRFVITAAVTGKVLVYWATEPFVAALAMSQWPAVYRARNDLQEHRFKRMIEHGALNTNYGRKKLIGPDRHQQRKQYALDQPLQSHREKQDNKAERIEQQRHKVHESQTHGHGKRLEQRQRTLLQLEQDQQALQRTEQQLTANLEALGPPRQRADHDFRKQLIMTFRTLLLENTLTAFHAALGAILSTPVSLDMLLSLLFERSGARIDTPTECLYWLNTQGLSLPHRRLLALIVEALCAMGLTHQGKPIRVQLRDRPP